MTEFKDIKIVNMVVHTTDPKTQAIDPMGLPLAWYRVFYTCKGVEKEVSVQTEWHPGVKTYVFYHADWSEWDAILVNLLLKIEDMNNAIEKSYKDQHEKGSNV